MNILVTGASGFIGRNLCLHLSRSGSNVVKYKIKGGNSSVDESIASANAIVHLAGVNRTENVDDYFNINVGLANSICEYIKARKSPVPIIFASTIHVERDTPYGKSKLAAERIFQATSQVTDSPLLVSRLANVFGRWGRPFYNSVVATFCHCIATGKSYDVHCPASVLRLVHVDDVIRQWSSWLKSPIPGCSLLTSEPEYSLSVGELARLIEEMKLSLKNKTVGDTGTGFERKLYSTFLSYLPTENIVQSVDEKLDFRGCFAELLKTKSSGQVSVLTARPGVTRGGHYHDVKNEKFIVLSGLAHFRFKNINSNERFSVTVDPKKEGFKIVTAIPGWTHDVTNIGTSDVVCLVWANEVFDPFSPDTYVDTI